MIAKKLAYKYILGFFYVFIIQTCPAQDQREADRLATIYEADTLSGQDKLELLKNLAFNEISDFDKKQAYAQELINLAERAQNIQYLYYGHYIKGDAIQYRGDLDEALSAYLKSAEVAASQKTLLNEKGAAYGAVADIYAMSDNHKNAMLYYDKAISTLRQTEDTIALASFILNAGDALLNNKKFDSALAYFKESGALFEQADYTIGKAYYLGNTGMVYAYTGKNSIAENNINEAIEILEAYEDYYAISVYLMTMADIYIEKGDLETAINYTQKSLSLANRYGLLEQLTDANEKLAELYDNKGQKEIAFKHYKDYIVHRDSLLNLETLQRQFDERTEFEVSQKQIEVELLEERTKNQRIILGFTALLFAGGLWFYRAISTEKKKSDKLLLNILPEDTATELKTHGKVKARKYEAVTVFFSDFKGFTSYSENLSPEELVKTVSFYFSKFDEIIDNHGLEKIKTIGDAYMCVGGIHDSKEAHAQRMVSAALEIADFVTQTKSDTTSELTFDIRIGIHSGPVVAGVVGTKKFAYDIWGDTVNVASRMESMSEPGRINVSETTYQLIKQDFDCEPRGEISVKNRGKLQMYFVNNAVSA
ncbi:adenylate/guanylate cyclase domain-containing protein [Winogradskyella aurantia]|uniref:Adenylate cyclase n=1 Tax=Winogradskyella aurantia TaxID=1915063 RepID=A0A265UT43_9FLAO|nr:adenylate/guanylate cyclase domain-containing protein [Winogradskyella aurantia]OZV68478.1 adenylate/guanylate cyclase domain-containing protein [Winogradskyella aurantia]